MLKGVQYEVALLVTDIEKLVYEKFPIRLAWEESIEIDY